MKVTEMKTTDFLKRIPIDDWTSFPLENGFRVYQTFVAKFLSVYDSLYINHNMGSGKTCTAFLAFYVVFNVILRDKTSKCLILVKSLDFLKYFKIQFEKCLTYLKNIDEDERTRINQVLATRVEFLSFNGLKDEHLVDVKLLIMDEVQIVHHCKHRDSFTNTHAQYMSLRTRIRHLKSRGCKILLMSGTPIHNHYSKFFEIMDFIVDEPFFEHTEEKQTFLNRFHSEHVLFTERELDGIVFSNTSVKEDVRACILARLKNKISTLKLQDSVMTVVEVGGYIDSHERIVKGTSAAQFFEKVGAQEIPNSSHYRTKVFVDDVVPNEQQYAQLSQGHNNAWMSARVDDRNMPNMSDPDFLKKHSILYYNFLREIGTYDDRYPQHSSSDPNRVSKEAIVFLNENVAGMNNSYLAEILTINHYQQIDQSHIKKLSMFQRKQKRFAVISSDSRYGISSENTINTIVKIFTSPENRYGEYIKIIIGSKLIAYGYNLINGRQVHIVLPWSAAVLNQFKSRVLRSTSNFSSSEENVVRIFQHYVRAIGNPSPFMNRLSTMESRNIQNANIHQLIDSISVDCNLNREYHLRTFEDNSHNCNFRPCSANFACITSDVAVSNMHSLFFIRDTSSKDAILKFFERTKSTTIAKLYQTAGGNTHYLDFLYTLLTLTKERTPLFSLEGIQYTLKCFKNIVYVSRQYAKFPTNMLTVIVDITRPILVVPKLEPLTFEKKYMLEKEKAQIQAAINGDEEALNCISVLSRAFLVERYIPEHMDKSLAVLLLSKYDKSIREYGGKWYHSIIIEEFKKKSTTKTNYRIREYSASPDDRGWRDVEKRDDQYRKIFEVLPILSTVGRLSETAAIMNRAGFSFIFGRDKNEQNLKRFTIAKDGKIRRKKGTLVDHLNFKRVIERRTCQNSFDSYLDKFKEYIRLQYTNLSSEKKRELLKLSRAGEEEDLSLDNILAALRINEADGKRIVGEFLLRIQTILFGPG